MVILALTKVGFNEMLPVIRASGASVWIGDSVLFNNELEQFRNEDIDLTDFNYIIEKSDSLAIQSAIETIKEHHPQVNVWVET